MGKELIFLCWEENLKREVEGIIDFLCVRAECFEEPDEFYSRIEGMDEFVVIVDVFLPKENGYLVCRKVKEKHKGSKVYLMVSKGLSKDELMKRWGADGIIYKPVEWREVHESLVREGIESFPPSEKAGGTPEDFLDLLFDSLRKARSCEITVNGEEIKISKGWVERDDAGKLLTLIEEEEISWSPSPLTKELNEDSILHLSEVLRKLTKKIAKDWKVTDEEVKFKFHEGSFWFLTPSEITLLNRIKRGQKIRMEEKLKEKVLFLSRLGAISLEFISTPAEKGKTEEITPPEEEEELKEIAHEPEEKMVSGAEAIAPTEEKIEFEEKEELMEVKEESASAEKEILAPPVEEREESALEEKKGPVLFSPPEELPVREALETYPEEKYKIMSEYEQLEEGESLLHEVLPPLEEEGKTAVPPEEETEPIETREIEEEKLKETHYSREMEMKEVKSWTPPKIEKRTAKRRWFLFIIIPPAVILLLTLLLLAGKRESFEKELVKASALLMLNDKEEFKKGHEKIRNEDIKIALQNIGYEAGWVSEIQPLGKCKKDENFCSLVSAYIRILEGEEVSQLPASVPKSLLSTYMTGRILLGLKDEKGISLLSGTGSPIANYVLVKHSCHALSPEKLREMSGSFADEWKRDLLLCASYKKAHPLVIEIFDTLKEKDRLSFSIAGKSYLEMGNEDGIKFLEEAGSPEAYYYIASFMEKRGKLEEARKYYSLVKEGEYAEEARRKLSILKEPSTPQVKKEEKRETPDIRKLIGMAVSERKKGNTQQALKLFEEALKMDPNNVEVNYHLGLIFLEMGDFSEAKKHFKRFLNNAPPDDGRRAEIGTLLESIP